MSKAVYAVGRFQPPTVGHAAMVDILKSLPGDAFVFVSSSQGTGKEKLKNPLTSTEKVAFLQKMFPKGVTFVDTAKCDPRCGGPLAAYSYLLEKGYKDITLVAGSDRASEFGPTGQIWKSLKDVKPPKFYAVTRDAEDRTTSADPTKMSGTKARSLAVAGDIVGFTKAVKRGNVTDADVKALYDLLRERLALPVDGKRGGAEEASSFSADEEVVGGRKTRRNGLYMSLRKKTRRGGKRIGEGTMNAVFSVPFPCNPPLNREVVMLISIAALNGIQSGSTEEELHAREKERPTRVSSTVLERLQSIDPKAERFYYPLTCSIRAPRDDEPIDESLAGLTFEQRKRLVPFVQIVPFGANGTLKSRSVTKEIMDTLRSDVAFLHENGIAHGDISKVNVVFDTSDRPHLIDFGQTSLRNGESGVIVPKGFEEDIPDWETAIDSDMSDLRRIERRREGGVSRTRRHITQNKASNKALYRRDLRSRNGSSRTNRS